MFAVLKIMRVNHETKKKIKMFKFRAAVNLLISEVYFCFLNFFNTLIFYKGLFSIKKNMEKKNEVRLK